MREAICLGLSVSYVNEMARSGGGMAGVVAPSLWRLSVPENLPGDELGQGRPRTLPFREEPIPSVIGLRLQGNKEHRS